MENKVYILSIETSISSAHLLRDYDGPCSRNHGHNWKIRVEVGTNDLDEQGIAIDFLDLKKITWQVVGPFDHNNFNDIPPFDKLNPTAENIVKYFYDEIEKLLPSGITMKSIRLWETEKYAVEYQK
jgi:6-pyruvoyltetrahydropterin/6-carboxytetrahydropterin synthase